jgi:hypothetical protein
MPDKELTPLAELIEWLKTEIKDFKTGNDIDRQVGCYLEVCILEKATELLPKERTMVEDAANFGYVQESDLQAGKKYFNSKYISNE